MGTLASLIRLKQQFGIKSNPLRGLATDLLEARCRVRISFESNARGHSPENIQLPLSFLRKRPLMHGAFLRLVHFSFVRPRALNRGIAHVKHQAPTG